MVEVVTGNRLPLYRQVARTLQQRVRTGQYRTGQPLPSVRTLSRELGVSPKVVQRATRELADLGVVVAHHGRDVRVIDDENCRRTAITFGFIQPYTVSLSFHMSVMEWIDKAFANRSNFAVVRSSEDDPIREREVAEHFLANGIRGLVVWPIDDDPNGQFFADLARRVPVVLIDRLLRGAELPAVVQDFHATGTDIGRHLLDESGHKRLLVLIDDLRISAYEEITRGIRDASIELKRETDVTVVQLPISRMGHRFTHRDFSDVDVYAPHVERLLAEGGYDAVFCTQGTFLDYVVVETGLAQKFPNVAISTLSIGQRHTGSRGFTRHVRRFWDSDYEQMISLASDLVQRWVLTGQMPKGVVRLTSQRVEYPAP
ncbi:MAG: GntR family transcriptional regulator [Phycisphaerae bacterium]|nr:GntR family transcriptional regulator [Phycisphaerae bacterium]